RHATCEQLHHRIMLRMDFFVLLADHLHASEDQKAAKNIQHPMKCLDQDHPHGKRHAAHNECPENAPKQHLILIDWRYAEIRQDNKKDEEIVDTQGFLNEIAGKKCQGGLSATQAIHAEIEEECQANPDSTPAQGLFDLHDVCVTMEDSEIKH